MDGHAWPGAVEATGVRSYVVGRLMTTPDPHELLEWELS